MSTTIYPSDDEANDGQWLERGSLVPRDLDGNRLNLVALSLSVPIALDTTTSPQYVFDRAIRLAYAVAKIEGAMPDALPIALANGAGLQRWQVEPLVNGWVAR